MLCSVAVLMRCSVLKAAAWVCSGLVVMRGVPGRALYAATPGEQVEDEDDDGENEQKVNPAAHRVAADKAKNPENDENDRDGPKHKWVS